MADALIPVELSSGAALPPVERAQVAMSVGPAAGLKPVVCGRLMIAEEAALYDPAQSTSSLVIYERDHLSSQEIFGLVCG